MRADLMCGASGNPSAGINDPERLGMISDLEAERLVVGAVNIDDLVSVQAYPKANRRGASLVIAVEHNDMQAAMSPVGLVPSVKPP